MRLVDRASAGVTLQSVRTNEDELTNEQIVAWKACARSRLSVTDLQAAAESGAKP